MLASIAKVEEVFKPDFAQMATYQ
jgi:hypothetical protein